MAFKCPHSLKEKLRRAAAREDRTMSSFIRKFLVSRLGSDPQMGLPLETEPTEHREPEPVAVGAEHRNGGGL